MNIKTILIICSVLINCKITAQTFGNWLEIDSLQHARVGHAMVVLQNGNVLVSGNDFYDSTSLNKSCEILDISINTWRHTTPMNMQKDGHQMMLLDNGEVLTFGGIYGRSCEIFNPITEEWRFTDSLINDRNFGGEAVVKLNDGRIMVIGGSHYNFDGNPVVVYNKCEIFDPTTEKWTETAPFLRKKVDHAAVQLQNGNILVGGKYFEIYSPQTNKWSITDSLKESRGGHSLILLDDGNVLLVGGTSRDSLGNTIQENRCALYNIQTEKWEYVGEIATYRNSQAVYKISEKYLIIVGGDLSDTWEIYDLENHESIFHENFPIALMLNNNNIIQMNDGNIIVVGGLEYYKIWFT